MMFWRKKNKDEQPQTPDEFGEKQPDSPSAPLADAVADAAPEAEQSYAPTPQPLPEAKEKAQPAAEEPATIPSNWLGRMAQGLSKSSTKITQGLGDLLTKRKLDQDMLDELEEVLISADLGPRTAAKLVAEFGRDRFGKDISDEEVKQALAESISAILRPVAQPLELARREDGPFVLLVCGVNGVGKTTTIGKIAYDLHHRKKIRVTLAAGDTFRAAAVEQLGIWAERAGADFVARDIGADAAAVAYESYEAAWQKGADVLMVDTAGRLHNKANLMQELEKIVRVLKKQKDDVPHGVLLVLDATTGQNAVEQVRVFKDMVNVTGLAVTKLDGSAKGGVVVALADQFGLPIHYVGVGEKQEDLQPFDPDQFARSLVGLPV